jgi:hypothetical protein
MYLGEEGVYNKEKRVKRAPKGGVFTLQIEKRGVNGCNRTLGKNTPFSLSLLSSLLWGDMGEGRLKPGGPPSK